MAKRKKAKAYSIILFFLVPFLMGLIVGITIEYKLLSNNNQTENKVIGRVEVINDDISSKLFTMINNTNLEKVLYNYRSHGVLFNNITNDEKLFLAGIDNYYKTSGVWTSFDTLKDNLVKSYGTDFNVNAEDYNFHDIAKVSYKDNNYTYDGKAFNYVDNQTYIDLYNSVKLEQEGNTYYLTVIGIYHQKLKDSENYSNDKGFVFNEAMSNNTSISDLYKTNKEQFMKYMFSFTKDNNTYILKEFIKGD